MPLYPFYLYMVVVVSNCLIHVITPATPNKHRPQHSPRHSPTTTQSFTSAATILPWSGFYAPLRICTTKTTVEQTVSSSFVSSLPIFTPIPPPHHHHHHLQLSFLTLFVGEKVVGPATHMNRKRMHTRTRSVKRASFLSRTPLPPPPTILQPFNPTRSRIDAICSSTARRLR